MEDLNKYLKRKDKASLQFIEAIKQYPFKSQEEARSLLDQYLFTNNYEFKTMKEKIPLDTPFTMRATKIQEKVLQKIEKQEDDNFLELSSSSEIAEDLRIKYHGDIHFESIDLSIKGKKILENATFKIVRKRIYGLIGRNGIGKSTLLKAIKKRKFNVSRGISIYLVKQESRTEDMTVLQFVLNNNFDCDDAIRKAKMILTSIGFNSFDINLKSLSGGWTVRASLAKAIYHEPDLLLLDEPTNMLDIPTIAWLEQNIKKLNSTVVVVSHDREFLNNICSDILLLDNLKIKSYGGNYDTFVELRKNELGNQKKLFEKQKADREHLQKFIDKFRYNAKRASLAQSKIKILENMELIEDVKEEVVVKFKFRSSELRGVLLEMKDVSFHYQKQNKDNDMKQSLENLTIENTMTESNSNLSINLILQNINLKITDKSRIVIVGPNGAGKSTLLKLLSQKLEPISGTLIRNPNIKPGYFTQHFIDQLKMNESVLGFIKKFNQSEEECRKTMAGFGLLADRQKIMTLSGGQKSRLAFSLISLKSPNILLLDEPTNHLDIESIDGLGRALNDFKGAIICVSHDMRFVEGSFEEVWVCEKMSVKRFNGTIRDYKMSLLQ